MKPRNKFEKAVLAQSMKLRTLTKKQLRWAFRECVDHFAHRLPKGRTTCMDCGHDFLLNKEQEHCACPQCGARLQVKTTYIRKIRQKQYFTLLTTSGEYQVLRMFLLVVGMEKGCKANSFALEIGQYWWNMLGKSAIVAIRRVQGCYIDTFSYASPMAIRNDNEAYRHIARQAINPDMKIADTLERNGFHGYFHGITPCQLIPALLSDSKAETLMKAGQVPLLRHYLLSPHKLEDYWAAVKICIRNGYTIEDGSMWHDYIDLLRHLGKDIHSPKYVCPSNLKAEHDRLMIKRNIQREREQLEKQKQSALKNEQKYKELKGRFFGLHITDGTLNIRVLESVSEFAEEGMKMCHCVFSNNYYLKENSLILSATIGGKRIETVEVSLKTLEVIQSRGLKNTCTEYHDRIIHLVNSNAGLIRKRMQTA